MYLVLHIRLEVWLESEGLELVGCRDGPDPLPLHTARHVILQFSPLGMGADTVSTPECSHVLL